MNATILASGPTDASCRVLFIGDSWVSRNKLDQGVIDQLGEGTRVCSICLTGFTSKKILSAVRTTGLLAEAMRKMGGGPDFIVIVCGVNDAIAHRGAREYGRNVRRIAEALRPSSSNIFALELPWISPAYRARPFASRARNLAFKFLRDSGKDDVTLAYRRALNAQSGQCFSVIPYDPFAPGYQPERFLDGVHIPMEETTKLGTYIASYISRAARENGPSA